MNGPVDHDAHASCATRIERQRPVLNADPRGRAAPIRPHIALRSLWSTVAWLVVAAACGSADSDEATPPLTSPDSALTTASTLARPGSPSSPTALPVIGATTDHEGPEPSVVTTASTATSTTTIADTPLGRAADELRASCGFVDLGVAPVDLSTLPPLGERAAEVDLSRIEGGAIPFLDGYTWSIASETDSELGLFGRPPEGSSIDPPFGYALFTRGAGGWDPTGFGQCRIEVSAPGWGNARFVLAEPPTDSSAELSLMATERACASGMPPTDREVRAVVREDETSVFVVILVEPSSGAQDCPSNPAFPLLVDLGEPLAGRTLIDASVQPGLLQTWAPTTTTVASGVIVASDVTLD